MWHDGLLVPKIRIADIADPTHRPFERGFLVWLDESVLWLQDRDTFKEMYAEMMRQIVAKLADEYMAANRDRILADLQPAEIARVIERIVTERVAAQIDNARAAS